MQPTEHYLNQTPEQVSEQLREIEQAIADLCIERQWPPHLLVLAFVQAAGQMVRQSTPDAEMPKATHTVTEMLHAAMRVRMAGTLQ